MRDAVIEKLVSSAAAGELTSFRIPGDDEMCLSVSAGMMLQAQKAWHEIEPGRRARVLDNVKRAVKSGLKRHRRGQLSQEECDEWASDCVLWFVHQLMFSDGERHIVESPSAAELKKLSN